MGWAGVARCRYKMRTVRISHVVGKGRHGTCGGRKGRGGVDTAWTEVHVKRCSRCERFKPLEDFHRSSRSADGRQGYCKPCVSSYERKRYKAVEKARRKDPEAAARIAEQKRRHRETGRERWTQVARTYGLSQLAWWHLWNVQGGRCAGCDAKFTSELKPHVDHDHETGEVRGLLCSPCNRGLGFLRDSPETLERLAGYLRRCATKVA